MVNARYFQVRGQMTAVIRSRRVPLRSQVGLVRTAALKLAREGITVNAVSPGLIPPETLT
jgi:hypothetical protein